MSKALVIKGVDFSVNKLATITLIDDIPCTRIQLSDATKELENVGTKYTLVATVTPSDTTDNITWSSSNNSIVSVAGGVLTVEGAGSAVITARCGNQSATCTVTTTNIIDYQYQLSAYTSGFARQIIQAESGTANYAGFWNANDLSSTEKKRVRSTISGITYAWPIELSNGTSKLTFDVPSNIRATVFFVDINTGAPEYPYCAILISGDASAYDPSVAVGPREVVIPDGANAFTFTLQYPGSGNAITDEIVAGITVTES